MIDRPVLEIRYGPRLLVLPVPAQWTGQIQLNIVSGKLAGSGTVKDRTVAYADDGLEIAVLSGAVQA